MSKLQTAINKLTSESSGRTQSRKRPVRPEDDITQRHEVRDRNLENNPFVEVSIDELVENGVTVNGDERRNLRDEMRRLKWPLLTNAFGDKTVAPPRGNIAMVASSVSGEGKTFVAVNLALSVANDKDFDVILIDADVVKPHVSRAFGVENQRGLIDYLAGEADSATDLIVRTDIPGLLLFPAGRRDEHASELLASKRMSDLVDELSRCLPNTVLLFDSSPLLQTNESQVLARLVGQVLMVVAANKTPQPAVKDAVALLDDVQVLNVVFNGNVSMSGQSHRYGGYYGQNW